MCALAIFSTTQHDFRRRVRDLFRRSFDRKPAVRKCGCRSKYYLKCSAPGYGFLEASEFVKLFIFVRYIIIKTNAVTLIFIYFSLFTCKHGCPFEDNKNCIQPTDHARYLITDNQPIANFNVNGKAGYQRANCNYDKKYNTIVSQPITL